MALVGVDRAAILEPRGAGNLGRTHSWPPRDDDGGEGSAETLSPPWLRMRRLSGLSTYANRLSDLPPEAAEDRKILEALGVLSFLYLPLGVGGAQIGALWLASTERAVEWTQETRQRLSTLASVFAHAISRRAEAERLGRRLALEQLIAGLSATFVNLPHEAIGRHLDKALERIGHFFEIDRCTLLELDDTGTRVVPTHTWVGPGAHPVPAIQEGSFPYLEEIGAQGRILAFSDPAELPQRARKDRAQFEKLGIRSFVSIAFTVGGAPLGTLSMASLDRRVEWSEETLERVRQLTNVLANAIARQRSERELSLRSRFDSLVADLSASFINIAPDALDEQIHSGLERISTFLGVDRSSIFRYEPETEQLRPSHAWRSENTEPSPPVVSSETFKWIRAQTAKGEIVAISSPEDLPTDAASEHGFFSGLGIVSFATVPLIVGGAVIGSMSFLTVEKPLHWTAEVLQRLRLVGEVFANAIARHGDATELDKRNRFSGLLLDLSAKLSRIPADQLDDAISDGLREVTEFLEVDRGTIFQLDGEREVLVASHGWSSEGIEAGPEEIPANAYPWVNRESREGRLVAISTIEDLPEATEKARQRLDRMGLTSFAAVPLMVGGSFLGNLSLVTLERRVLWSDDLKEQLQLLGEVFANAIARGQQSEHLEKRIRFEDLLLELSAKLAELPAKEIGPEVDRGLELVADYVEVDRVSFAEFDGADDLTVTHCFARSGYASIVGRNLRDVFPRYAKMLSQGETVRIDRSPSFEELQAAGIETVPLEGESGHKSQLAIPIVTGGNAIGVLSLSTFDRYFGWGDELIERLALVGGIFSSALSRRRSETDLAAAYEEIQVLNERLEAENVYLREELAPKEAEGIVGQSRPLRQVLTQVERVGPTDTTVLLTGETGTGKELVAEAIHSASSRRDRTMIRVNCAALPSTLIESELFGREKGAYTGATARQAGRFEAADGSTLFLDEIAELPLETQAKLLRVLEEGRFERLGSTRTLDVDVRIVAATNRDLAEEAAGGRFREDLFYRLEVFPIEVPPLRERRDDIPLLVWAFAREYAERLGKRIDAVPATHMQALQEHSWPGNVRELRNVVERAVILADGPTLEIRTPEGRATPEATRKSLDEVLESHIRTVLEQVHWRIRGAGGAAEVLHLKPTTLEYRMKKLGIRRPDSRPGSDD